MEDLSVCASVTGFLDEVGAILLCAPRSTVWFPVILLASEVVQLLVLHPVNAEQLQLIFKHIKANQTMAEGSLDSQVCILSMSYLYTIPLVIL